MKLNGKRDKIGKIFNGSFPDFRGKEAVMGKSLNGKEFGNNICQRKDRTYRLDL